VQLGNIKRSLYGLARCDDLERLFGNIIRSDTDFDAPERNLRACDRMRYRTAVSRVSLTALEDLHLLGGVFPK
jgi:hypothetical protein